MATKPQQISIGFFSTINEIKLLNYRTGHCFFSPDSVRFFNSRILDGVIGGRLFITSERYDNTMESERLYTVRIANNDGSIGTLGEFQQYKTADAARRAAHLAFGHKLKS